MKIRNIIIAMCSLVAVSCNFLNFDETSGLIDRDDLYSEFSNVRAMLTKVYVSMPDYTGFRFGSGINNLAMRDCASDDAEFGESSATIQNVNNGNWSASNTWDDAWSLYEGIRYANMFIQDFDSIDLSGNYAQGGYDKDMEQMRNYPYEARVLRAYYFFELARRYGDIAMPTTVLTKEEANTIGKTSFSRVIEFIVSECDECAAKLPETYADVQQQEIGRVTKGFALALKTKALLYAASPLHNESGDVNLWKDVARAAKEVMDLGIYSMDGEGVFNKTESPELILAKMNGNDNSAYELYNFPVRFTYGQRVATYLACGNYPSQNLVDAFETKNGYKVTLDATGWHCDDNAFREDNPYANRDPRFARTILADGMTFKGETLEVYKGGADDATVTMGGTPTGYFVRKFLQEDTNLDPQTTVTAYKHHWIISRYAEILLSYAEAMVNAFGDGNYTDSEFSVSALTALNEVRTCQRDGVRMPAVVNDSKENLLERIRNEWRVEFAFEDHRFWDVRRWKIGDQTQSRLYGVYITVNSANKKTYRQQLVENRVWSERMNLYPIPQSELFINGNLYPQNPQW